MQSHFDVTSLLAVVVAQFTDFLIRYGPALPGRAAFLLCLRPLPLPAPLATGELWQNVDPRSCVGHLIFLGMFLGSLGAHAVFPTHAVA